MNWTTPLWQALAPHTNKGSTFFLQPKSSSLVFLTLYFKTWLYTRALLSLLPPVDTNRLYTWRQNRLSKLVQIPGYYTATGCTHSSLCSKQSTNETELKNTALFFSSKVPSAIRCTPQNTHCNTWEVSFKWTINTEVSGEMKNTDKITEAGGGGKKQNNLGLCLVITTWENKRMPDQSGIHEPAFCSPAAPSVQALPGYGFPW